MATTVRLFLAAALLALTVLRAAEGVTGTASTGGDQHSGRPGQRLFTRSVASMLARLPRKAVQVLPFGSKVVRNDVASERRVHSRVMLLINVVKGPDTAAAPAIGGAATDVAKSSSTSATTTTATTNTPSTTGRVSPSSKTAPVYARLQNSIFNIRHMLDGLQNLARLVKTKSKPKYATFGSKLTKPTHESVQVGPMLSRYAPRGQSVTVRHQHRHHGHQGQRRHHQNRK